MTQVGGIGDPEDGMSVEQEIAQRAASNGKDCYAEELEEVAHRPF